MNPKAAEKSLNSNTRCRFPFTTLQPLSFRNSAAISCSESFVAAMKASPVLWRVLSFHSDAPGIIRPWHSRGKRAQVAQALLPVRFCMTHAQNSRPDDDGEPRTGRSACATKTFSESTFLQDEVESPGPAGTRGANHASRRVNTVGQEFADV